MTTTTIDQLDGKQRMKHETITGAEIQVGDVIRSAAMRRPHKVTRASVSSTGRTIEIETAVGPQMASGAYSTDYRWEGLDYRIGMSSKVKRYSSEQITAAEHGADFDAQTYEGSR